MQVYENIIIEIVRNYNGWPNKITPIYVILKIIYNKTYKKRLII